MHQVVLVRNQRLHIQSVCCEHYTVHWESQHCPDTLGCVLLLMNLTVNSQSYLEAV